MPQKRTFVCNRYKSYSIRNHYFENGLFQTDDPDVIKLIESSDGYGVFIHPGETPEELAAMGYGPKPKVASEKKAKTKPEVLEAENEAPIAHQGARGTVSTEKQRSGDLTVKKGK